MLGFACAHPNGHDHQELITPTDENGLNWCLSRVLRAKAVPLVAPNGAVLGVTPIDSGQQDIKETIFISRYSPCRCVVA